MARNVDLVNYGARETNPRDASSPMPPMNARSVGWEEPGLYVYRLRLLSDPGFPAWDVSYCFGRIKATGELVRVQLPFSQIPKGVGIKRFIVDEAKKAGVYARRLGILDNLSTLQ